MRDADIVGAIRRFNRDYTKRVGLLHGALLQHGFTLAEIRVMWEIAHKDHITAGEIATRLGMDPAVVSRLLRSLKIHQMVRTEKSEIDARIKHLRLTRTGTNAMRVLEQQSAQDVGAMIANLSRADREKLVQAMTRIESLLEARQDFAWDFVIRDPRPGDYGWVVERHGAIYADEYGWDATFEALVAEIVAGFIRGFKPGREKCWIAERGGERAGCVFLVQKSKDIGQLRLLLVEPSARGAGTGSRLVHECILEARAMGYAKLVLWTQANLHAAHRIYKAAGFRLVKEDAHESFGAKLMGQYWELDLRAPARSGARSTRRAR